MSSPLLLQVYLKPFKSCISEITLILLSAPAISKSQHLTFTIFYTKMTKRMLAVLYFKNPET